MRVAVVGATGAIGARTVAALRADGHEAVPIARSLGIDVRDSQVPTAVMQGVDAVVSVSSTPAVDPAEASEFFGAVASNLLAAERNSGVCSTCRTVDCECGSRRRQRSLRRAAPPGGAGLSR